ncbi:MAG: CBS domain-containing protein [Cyclobacteriaceae bacterium]|nr:CBS domain-containing protein [Cyclobacteriaceae bacterium]MCB9237435.1 CBS domain-containing protein [Flammeovirgaceae bacterium]MCB0500610.1 CBS domain-containing protein [Cyclobacteriaceae bacterium]MCO5273104.1 CBS domain-containing protein [Cyclobacteriaceae bacterium]MCW5903738.1 CBS domain-containing protein [Cyclobacteriaceae bacterium]
MNFKPEFEKEDTHKMKYETIDKYMGVLENMVTFRPDQSIHEAIDIIITKKISGAPVLDEQRHLIGNLSEKDCLRIIVDQAYHNLPVALSKVSDYMNVNVSSFPPTTTVVEAAVEFLKSPIRRYAVVENGVLIGQISRRDILRASQNIKPTNW